MTTFFGLKYGTEYVITLNSKKYIAVVSSMGNLSAEYYDYHSSFFAGSKVMVRGDFGNSGIPFDLEETPSKHTFYYGDASLIMMVQFYKDDNEGIIGRNLYLVDQPGSEKLTEPKEEIKGLDPSSQKIIYESIFDNTVIRVGVVDYILGQKRVVDVLTSTDGGKTFSITSYDVIEVAEDAKFIFFDKNQGFAIAREEMVLNNQKPTIFVTNDGGKTFDKAIFNYFNYDTDKIIIDGFPYYEDDVLKVKYIIPGPSRYELVFVSEDAGLTWMLESD